MRIKGLQDEDFVNYKKPSMFIGTSLCDWKCCNEQCLDKNICQNSSLANSKTIDVSADEIYRRYINNPITKAVVIGGLEPILQFTEVLDLIYNKGDIPDYVKTILVCDLLFRAYDFYANSQRRAQKSGDETFHMDDKSFNFVFFRTTLCVTGISL